MNNSKLHKVLVQFSTSELNRLEKFHCSPYLNTNADLSKLLTYLIAEVKRKSDLPERARLWNILYPEKPFDDPKLRKMLTEALTCVEQFIAFEHLLKNKNLMEVERLKSLKNREFSSLYKANVKRARNQLNLDIDQAGELFYHQYQFEQTLYDLNDSSTQRFDQTNLEGILHRLDTFYITEKLRHYCEILSRKSFSTHTVVNPLMDEIMEELERADFREVPIINIYYQIVQLHLAPNDESQYYVLRKLLEQSGATLPQKEMTQVYQSALNYCNRQINNGKSHFLEESFSLYKQFLQRELIFENGQITHWTFKNVVVLALRLKEFDWAKKFIDRYGPYIPASHRQNAMTYNLAQLYFYQGKYDQVLLQLQEVQYKDVTYNLGAKAMLIATYYELGEYEALHSLAASFRLYLNRRKTTISEKRRESYLNFIKFTIRLSKLPIGHHEPLRKLLETIKSTPSVASATWLKNKVESKQQIAPIQA